MSLLTGCQLNPAKTIILLGAVALFASAGCVTSDSNNTQDTPTSQPPKITLVSPSVGETLPADGVDVTVAINGFHVDPNAIGEAKVEGYGHWHLYLDGEFVQASAEETVHLEPLPQGPHHVRVALANNDHSALTPPVEDSAVVDIVGGNEVASSEMKSSSY